MKHISILIRIKTYRVNYSKRNEILTLSEQSIR